MISADNYYVEVSTNSDLSSPLTKYDGTVPIEAPAISFTVTELSSGTTYHYRVTAENATGRSGVSNVISQITIPANPTATSATTVTQNSFLAQWEPVTGVVSYYLTASINEALSDPLTGYDGTMAISSANTSTAVSDLTEATLYYYGISAENSAGISGVSNIVSQLTIPANPVATETQDIDITATSFKAGWDPVTGAESYELEVSLDEFATLLAGYNPFTLHGTEVEITNLQSETTYQFRVRSKNSAGVSENSNIISVATLKDVTVEPSLPDLVPQILSIDATIVGAGAAVNAVVRVLNQSAIDAASSTLAYFISTDNALDDMDVVLGEAPTDAIIAFELYDFEGSVLIPAATSPGDYFLIFEADALEEVNEINEDNNETFVAITVVALGDILAPSIAYVDRPEGYVPGTGGFTITVRASDQDSGIDRVGYFFKKITDPGGDQIEDFVFALAQQSSGDTKIYQAAFSDDDFGTLGIEYLFVAVDRADNSALTNLISLTTTLGFEANSQPLVGLTAGTEVVDFELISFPLIFDDPRPANVFDELGNYDKKVWRFFHWNNSSQAYIENPSGAAGSIQAGLGYWLIFTNQVTLQVGNSRAVDATLTRPFVITLRDGWNQIGNPYLGTISWSGVLDHNITEGIVFSGDVSNPFTYSRGFSEVSDISAFEGAFVESNGTIQLEIPLRVSGVGGRQGRTKLTQWENPLDASSWEVRFNLQASNYAYNLGGLGMHQEADINKDQFDRSTLPRLSEYLELNFAHPEHIIPFFTRDVVPTAENHTWEFTIENGLEDKKLTLSWENDFFGVSEKHLVLFDIDRQKAIDMGEMNTYEFGISGVKKFKAIYGDLEYIESELQPNRLILGNAYPNPFDQQTIIPYSLSESNEIYKVNLSIYNSLGQKIITLVSQEQPSGFYEAVWKKRSDRGTLASPGIYIYQLRVSGLADNPVLSGKLIVR